MYQQKNNKKTMWVVASVLLVLVAMPLYAAMDKCTNHTSNQGKMLKSHETSQMTEKQAMLYSIRDLLGSDVKSKPYAMMNPEHSMSATGNGGMKSAGKGEMKRYAKNIGTVKEVVIDNHLHKIDCVILSSEKKLYPVPWWAFDARRAGLRSGVSKTEVENPGVNGRYIENWTTSDFYISEGSYKTGKPILFLNLTKEQLHRAPTINSISLERLSNAEFRGQVCSFYSKVCENKKGSEKEGYVKEQAQSEMKTLSSPAPVAQSDLLRASKVIGLKVRDSHEENLGKIENLLANGREGHLTYGLVSFGGFLGIGEKTAAVPWSELTIWEPQGYARLNADRKTLEAAVIDRDHIENLAERQYARRIYNAFDIQPNWEVLGFVPGEEATMSENPWLPGSNYNKHFDPNKLTTIEGTIKSVSSISPKGTTIPGTVLKVTTKDGTSVNVCAGPSEYVMHKGLAIESGKNISVTGCQTTINGKSVFLASELRVEGKTVQLRDSMGKPEWKIESPQR